MSKQPQRALDLSENMLIALRRVIRAVDLHSRSLVQSHGLTGPQPLLLRATFAAGGPTPGELARRLSLSQAIVTDIVKRLEARGLLRRTRDELDRRRVVITATAEGEALNRRAPRSPGPRTAARPTRRPAPRAYPRDQGAACW